MRMFIKIAMVPIIAIVTYITLNDPNHKPEIEQVNSFALVQLYTSQGCSSCPSADRLLETIKSESRGKNVYVMSYHVDYWNRLGWKDPYSQKAFTQKQYAYGDKFGEGRIYTPQAIINGKGHFVGSNKSIMNARILESLSQPSPNLIEIQDVSQLDKEINVEYKVGGELSDKSIYLALVIENRQTKVLNGENKGRVISNSNIVVNESYKSLTSNRGLMKLTIPELVEDQDQLRLIAYIQDDHLNISGATSMKLK